MKIKKYQNAGDLPYMPADNISVVWNPQRQDTVVARRHNPAQEIDITDNPMGYAPVVGDILQGGQAIIDFSNGDWKRGTLNLALLAVPNVLEKPVKAGVKVLKSASKNKVAQKYFSSTGKIDLKLLLSDIDAGKQEAIDFLKSETKKNSGEHNRQIAKRIGLENFAPYNGAAGRASVPMKKPTTAPYTDDAIWVGSDSNGYFIVPGPVDDVSLGKAMVARGAPDMDQVYISVLEDPKSTTFHETLHRGSYGTVPDVKITQERLLSAIDTDKFYAWKTQKLLSSEGLANDYISQPAEAAVNALQAGKVLGIAPGAPYPGKTQALKIFEDASDRTESGLEWLSMYNWKEKPKRVWDAITGNYYMLPAAAVIGAGVVGRGNNEQ